MAGSVVQKIMEPVDLKLGELGIELVDIEYHRENGEQILRIYVDKESGVNLDLCTLASRAVKEFIDSQDITYDHFEVSSPGLNRVLKKDKDLARFTGYKVKIMALKEFAGPRKNIGILEGFSDVISVIRLHPDF